METYIDQSLQKGKVERGPHKIVKIDPPSGDTPLGYTSPIDYSVPDEHERELRRGRKIGH